MDKFANHLQEMIDDLNSIPPTGTDYYLDEDNNKFIVGAVILDLFLEYIENGLSHITLNEILEILGESQNNIDFNNTEVYDLRRIAKNIKDMKKVQIYEEVQKSLIGKDFGDEVLHK